MSPDDVSVGRKLLVLEARAAQRMRSAVRATVTLGASDEGRMAAALVASVARVSLDVRTNTRAAAAAQFSSSTGVDVEPSGASDKANALSAGRAYVRTWIKKLHAQEAQAGGATGGGGSSDDWNDARLAAQPKLGRIAAWDVMHAWNDEHRRNAIARPAYAWKRVWCAYLDKHLCPACRGKHGAKLTDATPFAGWPPLHESCRCFVSTSVTV